MPGRNLHVAFLRSIIFKVFIHRVTLAVLVCASQCWVWSPGHRSSCDHDRLIQGCDCGDDEGRSPTIFLFSSSNDLRNRIILWKAILAHGFRSKIPSIKPHLIFKLSYFSSSQFPASNFYIYTCIHSYIYAHPLPRCYPASRQYRCQTESLGARQCCLWLSAGYQQDG